MATLEGQVPPVPEGWQVSWNYQHNQWLYFHQASNTSQWEYPSGPPLAGPPVTTPPPAYYDPAQPQGFSPAPTAGEPSPGERGIMGNTTLFGGGMAAGAFLGHKIDEFKHHHGSNQDLGTMAGLLGTAGAGALGAKLSGFFGKKSNAQASPPVAAASAYPGPISPAPAPAAPVATSPGPGFGSPGTFAAGSAAGYAAGYASGGAANPFYYGNPGGPPPQLHEATTGGGAGSFFGGFAPSGPRLIIHGATYADMDVAAKVMPLVTPDQVLSLDCKKLNDEFGDPWPENGRKSFNVLYQYGDRPLEVWAGSTEDGRVDIRNEALSNARMSFVNQDPGRIIALIWGQQSVLSKERVAKLETAGELDCSGLGDGGFYPWEQRTLICYYRTPQGGVAIGHGREGGTLRLPWNPLAKWS